MLHGVLSQRRYGVTYSSENHTVANQRRDYLILVRNRPMTTSSHPTSPTPPPEGKQPPTAKSFFADVVIINTSLGIFAALGIVALCLFWDCNRTLAFTWGLASVASGAIVGFLFGIPREDDASDSEPAQSAKVASPVYRQRINANLEEVSDWLTKIIVGLGLFELREIPSHLMSMAAFMAGTDHPECRPFAAAVIVYFAAGGFLFGYLYTRLYLAGAIYRAVSQMGAPAPADPMKGRWGGKPQVSDREIGATVNALSDMPGWYKVSVTVRSTNAETNPLQGNVIFHLPNTFRFAQRVVAVKDNVATIEEFAQQAFTVGAESDNRQVRLELDLNDIESTPLAFRSK